MTQTQWSALAGLIGVLLLAYPAISAGALGLKLARLKKITIGRTSATGDAIKRLQAQIAELRDRWSMKMQILVIGGVCFSALSYLISLWPARS